MGQILSQDEVDALLRGMVGGEVETRISAGRDSRELLVTKPYDFASHEKITRGKLPSLDAVYDRFGRLFRVRLTGMLRRMVEINYASLETIRFGNFMRSVSVPSSINIVSSEKFGGHALIILETKLVISLVDIFFGGGGPGSGFRMQGREFTSIEQSMLKKVADGAIKDLNDAFKPAGEIGLSFSRNESNPQFAGIINDNETVVVAELEVSADHSGGSIMLCMPYQYIEPMKTRNHAKQKTMQPQGAGDMLSERFRTGLGNVPVEISAELGSAKITGRQISKLKKGDVIMLGNTAMDEIKIKVQGKKKFLGAAGTTGDYLAVEIIKVFEDPS